MELASVVLILGGVLAIVVGLLMMRAPYATISQLDETEANLERYETWRGKRTGVEADGPTGADIMRQQMRQRLRIWAAVAAGGAVSVVLGLLLG